MNINITIKQKRIFILIFIIKITFCYILFGITNINFEIKDVKKIILKDNIKQNDAKYSLLKNKSTNLDEIKSISYINIHKNIVLNRIKPKVIFYKVQTVGYGNRIYSMISSFLAAILSDSSLLIDWPSIDNYIDCPLAYTFNKFNDSSFLDLNQKWPKICLISTNTSNTWSFKKHLDFLQGILL